MTVPGHARITTVVCIVFSFATTIHSADNTVASLAQFNIAEKNIGGWTAAEGDYREFGPDELYGIINGGADLYVNNGLVRGTYQRLLLDDTLQCEIFIENFGSSENANTIFAATTETASNSLKLTAGDNRHIKTKEFIGGILVYMHQKHLYFEISVSGFNSTEEASTSIKPLINYLGGIISQK